jgi:lipoprotein-anchoring transpeptidase ErfK/SrfK
MFSLAHRASAGVALFAAALIATALLTSGPRAGARGVPAAPLLPAPPHARAHATGQSLVVLTHDHVVHAAPDGRSRQTGHVGARRPLTHVRTTLPVLRRTVAPGGGSWVQVRLPGRPNGHAGWISADHTRRASTQWRITVRLSTRLVTVAHRGRVMGRFRTVVGTRSAPTPRGHFFVEEIVPLTQLGRPYALAVSARSNVYQQFGGGPGQIALHGTTGLTGAPGTAVSHGCLRLSPRAMSWLARRVGPGVPVVVRR